MLDLIGLLDLDADAHRVYAGLDEDALVLVARNRQWREEDLGGGLGLDLGDIVALGVLGGEVGEGSGGSIVSVSIGKGDGSLSGPSGSLQGGCQATPDALEVWT